MKVDRYVKLKIRINSSHTFIVRTRNLYPNGSLLSENRFYMFSAGRKLEFGPVSKPSGLMLHVPTISAVFKLYKQWLFSGIEKIAGVYKVPHSPPLGGGVEFIKSLGDEFQVVDRGR